MRHTVGNTRQHVSSIATYLKGAKRKVLDMNSFYEKLETNWLKNKSQIGSKGNVLEEKENEIYSYVENWLRHPPMQTCI